MFKKLAINKGNMLDVFKSLVFSLVFSMLFILIFALFVKYLSLGENVIVPVNYFIKIISVLLGCLLGYKNMQKGAVKGFFSGIMYYLLSILLFSIFSGSFDLVKFSIIDVICIAIVGVLCGIITVNVKKDRG